MAIRDKTLITFIILDVLFLACGCAMVGLPVASRSSGDTLSNVAQNLLMRRSPLTAEIANGILMLITFSVSVPGIVLKKNRTILIVHSWLLIANAIFTLCIGLAIWYSTLLTRSNLAPLFNSQPSLIQSMLQFKFNCCGYNIPGTFVTDSTCLDATVASSLGSCVAPLSAFANSFLDIVFTSMFGFCALDGLLLVSGMCVLKDRAEKARYRLIDEKRGSYSKF